MRAPPRLGESSSLWTVAPADSRWSESLLA